MRNFLPIILLSLELIMSTYSTQYIDSLITEEPYYDKELRIFKCENKFKKETFDLYCDYLEQINIVYDFTYD